MSLFPLILLSLLPPNQPSQSPCSVSHHPPSMETQQVCGAKLVESKYEETWDLVREQYETFPCPEFGPEDLAKERKWYHKKGNMSLALGAVEETLTLEMINHFLFKGTAPFQSGLRVLLVGDGTGNSTLFLAQQLRHTNTEIVYLDLSGAAMDIARARGKIRELNNIRWIRDRLENIPSLNLGKFDFIEAKGVLTHLRDPSQGLKLLSSLLTPRGGISLMLYSKYARTGVYQIQELMRLVNKFAKTKAEEILNTRKVLKILPPTNWYKRAEIDQHEAYGDYRLGSYNHPDSEPYSDTEIYDIFLNKQDTGFSIPEVYDMLHNSSLHLVDYSLWSTRLALQLDRHVKHSDLRRLLRAKSKVKQEAIAELIIGYLTRYHVYVSNDQEAEASFTELDNVPFMYGNTRKLGRRLEEAWKYSEEDNFTFDPNIKSTLYPEGTRVRLSLRWPINKFIKMFLDLVMEDQQRTIGELLEIVQVKFPGEITRQELLEQFETVFKAAKQSGQMLLRHKSAPEYELTKDLTLYSVYTEEEERERQT